MFLNRKSLRPHNQKHWMSIALYLDWPYLGLEDMKIIGVASSLHVCVPTIPFVPHRAVSQRRVPTPSLDFTERKAELMHSVWGIC